jgi:signal peptidase II
VKKRTFVVLLVAASLALIGLDQAAKWAADTWLRDAGTVRILGDFIVLVYAKNTGAFLSMGSKLPEPLRIAFLIVIPTAVLAAFLAVFLKKKVLRFRDLALLSLLLGGGMGNIIDRIFRGEVTDYLLFQLTQRIRTGVMNLADLYILAVILMIAADALFSGKPREKADSPDSSG